MINKFCKTHRFLNNDFRNWIAIPDYFIYVGTVIYMQKVHFNQQLTTIRLLNSILSKRAMS
jgi:hypothetical protein